MHIRDLAVVFREANLNGHLQLPAVLILPPPAGRQYFLARPLGGTLVPGEFRLNDLGLLEVKTVRGLAQHTTHILARSPVVGPSVRRRLVAHWLRNGKRGAAPHGIKQANLRRLADAYQISTLVETGTYAGDMVAAMCPHFDRVISIELSQQLHHEAVKRFSRQPHVELLQGDSGRVLAELCPALSGRILFWLDGHYSGGITACGDQPSPIMAELEAIYANRKIEPVIVIDDARCFNGNDGYPTLATLADWHRERSTGALISVHDDAIFLLPYLA